MQSFANSNVSTAVADGPGDGQEFAMWTVKQVGQALRCSERTVWSMIERGELCSIKVGKLRRIPRCEVMRYVRERLGA